VSQEGQEQRNASEAVPVATGPATWHLSVCPLRCKQQREGPSSQVVAPQQMRLGTGGEEGEQWGLTWLVYMRKV